MSANSNFIGGECQVCGEVVPWRRREELATLLCWKHSRKFDLELEHPMAIEDFIRTHRPSLALLDNP
jgi:hypothetical protein